jgi:hypothetical protein
VSARQVPRKGATDGAVSERSRGGRSVQEVRDWNPPTPLGTVIRKATRYCKESDTSGDTLQSFLNPLQ